MLSYSVIGLGINLLDAGYQVRHDGFVDGSWLIVSGQTNCIPKAVVLLDQLDAVPLRRRSNVAYIQTTHTSWGNAAGRVPEIIGYLTGSTGQTSWLTLRKAERNC